MTVRWRRQGKDFSAREVAQFPTDSGGARETLRAVADARGFEGWARGIEEAADALLGETGCDPKHPATFYARETKKLLEIVRDAITRGEADTAARYAAELGSLVREYDLKAEYEAPAMTGAKVREGGSDGAAARRRITAARDRVMAQAFEDRRGKSGLSPSALKAEIGKERGMSRANAIKAINRALKEIVSNPAK